MAGKWKMAKAFGRAIVNKSDDNLMKQSARESISKDIDRKFVAGDKDAADRAAAFNKGYFEGGRASRGKQEPYDYYTNGPENLDAAESRLDDFTDRTTDNELNRDFDEAFDEVMGDDAEDVIRKNAIEMLKAGKSISDVLSILKMR